MASYAQGYDADVTRLALQSYSSTFRQHGATECWRRFREPSYNAFILDSKKSKTQDDRSNQAVGEKETAREDEPDQAAEQNATERPLEQGCGLEHEPGANDQETTQGGGASVEKGRTAKVISLAASAMQTRIPEP